MKIFATGLSGLVGSRIEDLLKEKFVFFNASLETGVDITDKDSVLSKFKEVNPDVVLHLAAKTDVDGCEKDKVRDLEILKKDKREQNEIAKTEKTAWVVNVLGTENVVSAALEFQKKVIYISTDFVFDGEKESYTEEDAPNPLNWYSKTKYEGEKVVQQLPSWQIIRIAYPYRADYQRPDLVRLILGLLKQGRSLKMVTDHYFCPTFIDDIVSFFEYSVSNKLEGIYHCVGEETLSPYDLGNLIAGKFNLDKSLISKTSRQQYFQGKAKRPFKLLLKNGKIIKFGLKNKTVSEGLDIIKIQNPNL